MPQISYIKYIDVLEARRYDAEYFKPEYLEIEERLNRKGFNSLKSISSKIFRNPMMYGFSYIEKKYDGFPFIRIDDLNNPFIELESCEHISKEINEKYNSSQLFYGDIVMGVRGNTIGRLGVYNGKDKEANISPNVIFFRLKDKNYSNFIALYLLSKYGKLQIERMLNGTGQPTITSILLNELKIPILPQSFQLQIEEIVRSAHQKQTQSKQLYREAEELLMKEIFGEDCSAERSSAFPTVLWFTTTKTEVNEAHRYDSEYFQPKYAEIIKKIENYDGGWDLVKNQFKIINGKTPEQYFEEEKEIQVLKTKQIRNEAIQYESVAYSEKEFVTNILQERDVLFASMGVGSLGRTGIFYNFETDKKTSVDSTIKIFRNPKKIEPEVLQTFFNSIIGQEYIYRYVVGSTGIISIKNDFILDLKIPLIKPSIQKQIAEKIQESHKLRKESKELLEEAKRKVEEEIEK